LFISTIAFKNSYFSPQVFTCLTSAERSNLISFISDLESCPEPFPPSSSDISASLELCSLPTWISISQLFNDQSLYQSHSSNQSINQSIYQSINQFWINQATNQPTNQPTNQQTNKFCNWLINQSIKYSIKYSIKRPINQSVNHSTNERNIHLRIYRLFNFSERMREPN